MKQYLKNLVCRIGRLAYPQEQLDRLLLLTDQLTSQQEKLDRLLLQANPQEVKCDGGGQKKLILQLRKTSKDQHDFVMSMAFMSLT
jgi:hypothetical protein